MYECDSDLLLYSLRMMKTVLRAVLAAVIATTLVAQTSARKPPTHEALWMMKRVGAPLPSPDGKWVIYSVTEPSYDEKEVSSDLWLVASDGTSAPHRIRREARGR
jgi:hypothetical protein